MSGTFLPDTTDSLSIEQQSIDQQTHDVRFMIACSSDLRIQYSVFFFLPSLLMELSFTKRLTAKHNNYSRRKMSPSSKRLERTRKIVRFILKFLGRFFSPIAKIFRFTFGSVEEDETIIAWRKQEERERRKSQLLKRIHYEELLAEQGGTLRIYAKFAQRDRELYRTLYGMYPGRKKIVSDQPKA